MNIDPEKRERERKIRETFYFLNFDKLEKNLEIVEENILFSCLDFKHY